MPKCSFCGRNKKPNELVQGVYGLTCHSCALVSSKVSGVNGCDEDKSVQPLLKISKPSEIKKELDEFIVGQEEAKRLLAVEVYNHLRRVTCPEASIRKSNVLLVGPTGSGKTLFFEVLSGLLDVPVVIVDATTYTEVGYIGKDVYSCLNQLLLKTKGDIAKAEMGIVYIDEADKMVTKKSDGVNSRDIRGEGVQQAFLKMIEGSDIGIEIPSEQGNPKYVELNTRNILFVFGGTFDGINKIVADRVRRSRVVSLVNVEEDDHISANDYRFSIESSDIVKYGFIKEFVGRVPLIVPLQKLTAKQMMDILKRTSNSAFHEYRKMFKHEGVDLQFEDDAFTYIIEQSMRQNVGARGLRGVMSRCLNPLMYDATLKETHKIVVTRAMLESLIARK